MAGIFKRTSDRARGKAGKYTAWWVDEQGVKRNRVAYTDKGASLALANELEQAARRVREGLVEPGERGRKAQQARPMVDHLEDYRLHLLDRDDEPKHAAHVAGVLCRLLADAAIGSAGDLAPDRIGSALGRLRQRRSARTCNHALGAVKAFAKWLAESNRLKEVPRGLASLKPYSESTDRRKVRRALTAAEFVRLIATTEAAGVIVTRRAGRGGVAVGWLSGPDRAMLYRVAAGTGFRVNELASLTPVSFRLDAEPPTIIVEAAYSKRRREDLQPIYRDLANRLRDYLVGRDPATPVWAMPEKAAAMFRADLAAAGIVATTPRGVVDFHALRHTFISWVVASGATVRVAQDLARHSTPILTIGRYAHAEDHERARALDALESANGTAYEPCQMPGSAEECPDVQ